jgi:hypothetical protein
LAGQAHADGGLCFARILPGENGHEKLARPFTKFRFTANIARRAGKIMKVLDLRCAQDHRFEGWFASEEDAQSQISRDLVQCPVCGDHAVSRLPSAPRLNLSGATAKPAQTQVRPRKARPTRSR